MTLAQAFPFAFFLLLAELAVGSFLVLLLADFEGEVGRGFLGLNGLIFLAAGLVGQWARTTYPDSDQLAAAGIRVEWVAREGRAFAFFLLFLALYHVLTWFPWPPWPASPRCCRAASPTAGRPGARRGPPSAS